MGQRGQSTNFSIYRLWDVPVWGGLVDLDYRGAVLPFHTFGLVGLVIGWLVPIYFIHMHADVA